MGIDKYNSECRAIVMRYSKVRCPMACRAGDSSCWLTIVKCTLSRHTRALQEWEATVERIGRWIDFENDYKTLNPTFMESVWWVFSELFKKGLVYSGFKVHPGWDIRYQVVSGT